MRRPSRRGVINARRQRCRELGIVFPRRGYPSGECQLRVVPAHIPLYTHLSGFAGRAGTSWLCLYPAAEAGADCVARRLSSSCLLQRLRQTATMKHRPAPKQGHKVGAFIHSTAKKLHRGDDIGGGVGHGGAGRRLREKLSRAATQSRGMLQRMRLAPIVSLHTFLVLHGVTRQAGGKRGPLARFRSRATARSKTALSCRVGCLICEVAGFVFTTRACRSGAL